MNGALSSVWGDWSGLRGGGYLHHPRGGQVAPDQAEAERERRAKVIHAEGVAQAAEKLAEAANIISAYPAAMQLRFLQTLSKVSAEKSSTIILPLPIDLLTAFLQKKEKE